METVFYRINLLFVYAAYERLDLNLIGLLAVQFLQPHLCGYLLHLHPRIHFHQLFHHHLPPVEKNSIIIASENYDLL